MLRTALVSIGLIALAHVAASWLTEGFEVWTAEGARRLAVNTLPVPAPPVTLAGAALNGLSLSEVLTRDGHVTIVDFVYTRCASVCLGLGSGFQQLQQALMTASADRVDEPTTDRIGLLSISFDPTHDGEAQLQQYASQWRADRRCWRFATVPDAAQLRRLLAAFKVTVIADGQGGYEHNAALLVIDAHGRLVRIFDADEPDAALAFARSLLSRPAPRQGPYT